MSESMLNTSPLTGLRGFLAFYIMLFHSLLYSDLSFNIFGQVLIPWFYILSGFCLTLKYGNQKSLNFADFMKSRVKKILPIYYFTFIIAFPLIFLGHNYFNPNDFYTFGLYSCILSLFGIQSWILLFGFGPVGPSWTISTIWFFYLNFPWILKYLKQQTNEHLLKIITVNFYLQLFGGVILYFLVFPHWTSYWLATAWPVSRIPLFIMGICGGILVTRSIGWKSIFHGNWILPGLQKFPILDHIVLLYSFCTFLMIVLLNIENFDFVLFSREGFLTVFLQLIFGNSQILVIFKLCFDQNTSYITKILKRPIFQVSHNSLKN